MHNIINSACECYKTCDHVMLVGNCNGCGNLHGYDERERKNMNKYDEIVNYCMNNINTTQEFVKRNFPQYIYNPPRIKNVIFNEPATIVFWEDGSKTVVKCQDGDIFDPEKGLTMAITKKVYGNKGNYCEEIKKWVDPYYAKMEVVYEDILDNFLEKLRKGCEDINEKLGFGFKMPTMDSRSVDEVFEDLIKKDDAECQE